MGMRGLVTGLQTSLGFATHGGVQALVQNTSGSQAGLAPPREVTMARVRELELASLLDPKSIQNFGGDDARFAKDVFDLDGNESARQMIERVRAQPRPSLWNSEAVRFRIIDGMSGGVFGGFSGGVVGGMLGVVGGGIVGGVDGTVGAGVFGVVVGVVVGVVDGVLGGVLDGIVRTSFYPGASGLIAGVGTAFSLAYAIELTNPAIGIGGTLASLALCMGLSIAGNVIGPIYKGIQEHKQALPKWTASQDRAKQIQADLDNVEFIKGELSKNPELYQHYLESTLLPMNAAKKEELETLKKKYDDFFTGYDKQLETMTKDYSARPRLRAQMIVNFKATFVRSQAALTEIQRTLDLVRLERESLEWELAEIKRVIQDQASLLGAIENHLKYLGAIEATNQYAERISESIRLEILATFIARQEIMKDLMTQYQSNTETKLITEGFDVGQELQTKRDAIYAKLTQAR